MKKSLTILMIAAAVCLCRGQNISAAQNNFVISPPPIPWFEFKKGQTDLKVGGSYVSLSSENNDTDVSISGGGINLTARYAFVDQLAGDFMFNYLYIEGDVGGGDSVFINFLSWNPNFEIQPFKNDTYNLILFGGFMWTLVPLTYYPADGYAISVTANMSGIQLGAQFSVRADNFSIAPFFLYQDLSGSADVGGYGSVDIPSQSVTTYGLDVVYIPFDITLSGLMQQVKDNSEFKVFYLAMSYDFRWGDEETAVMK